MKLNPIYGLKSESAFHSFYNSLDEYWCRNDLIQLYFPTDGTTIYFHFWHTQRVKSPQHSMRYIYEQMHASGFDLGSDSSFDSFVSSIDFLILNTGNNPFYNASNLFSDLNANVTSYRMNNGKNERRIPFLFTSMFQLHPLATDTKQYLRNERMFDSQSILFEMDYKHLFSREYFQKKFNKNLLLKGKCGTHYCMPSAPLHIWLLFIEIISFILG